jgi:hypothetical protein
MGYRVLGRTENVYQGYGPRRGLEGPFVYNGRVLYYDAKEGKYWDPRTDFFVDYDEWESIMNSVVSTLASR